MDVCAHSEVLKVIYFIMTLIDIVKIIIPIALIVFGLIDFSKAAISSDEKVQKKSGQLFLKRLLYGILVFTIPWIVEVLMVTLGNLLEDNDTMNFTDCLENAESECIEALESKNINTIKSKCDVPKDFTIKEESSNGSENPDNGGTTDVNAVCWQCNGDSNVLQWGKSYPSDSNCPSGWHQVNYTYSQCKKNDTTDINFNKNITYSYHYEPKSNGLSYALFTPSTAKTQKEVPLIIFLHGVGTRGIPQANFEKNLNQFKNTGLQNFNAYVLYPHMDNPDSRSGWSSGNIVKKFYSILDEVTANNNIDKDKIILIGFSMGGVGVYGISDGKTDLYSALVVMSASNVTVKNEEQYSSVPVRGYVGSEEGEYEPAYEYMNEDFVKMFGNNNLVHLDVDHGMIPLTAYKQDLNNNKKSDLIEWALAQ